MIKFQFIGKDGSSHIGLGLSEANIQKLKQNLPIVVNLAEISDLAGKVMIFYGKTEAHMEDRLSEFIGPDTKRRVG